MNYQDYKEIEKKANEIGFALAKIVNNFCDVLKTAGLEKYITKGELLDMLFYDGAKDMIKLKPNYRALIFDAVSIAEFMGSSEQNHTQQKDLATSIRDTQKAQRWQAIKALKNAN